MTATDTIAALCRAVDKGDGSVLPILADALADDDDPRAEGLREAAAHAVPRSDYGRWTWQESVSSDPAAWHEVRNEVVPAAVYARLSGGRVRNRRSYVGRNGWVVANRNYRSRSAAYLALAEALSYPGIGG
jgi:hypothetical protein